MGQFTFACAINCMDGRFQDPVKDYLIAVYDVDYVDMVTEPGPNKILAEGTNLSVIENIKKRVGISVHHHNAKIIAIVGHFDCAGNPADREEQIKHLKKAKKTVQSFGFNIKIVLLWVKDDQWEPVEVVD